jgi:hypothetical protein
MGGSGSGNRGKSSRLFSFLVRGGIMGTVETMWQLDTMGLASQFLDASVTMPLRLENFIEACIGFELKLWEGWSYGREWKWKQR